MMTWNTEMVHAVGTIVIHLTNVGVTAYLLRTISREVFLYLNHRLDVLGKDAFLFYPTDRYEQGADGRMILRQESVSVPVGEDPAAPLSIFPKSVKSRTASTT